MNECVNTLMALEGKPDRFGHSEAADALGVEIMEAIDALVKAHKNPYCEFWNGSFILHAQVGIRYFSTYSSDSDVIRITGYLVKKSDIEKLEQNQQVVNDTVVLGMGAKHNGHILDRKVRSL